MSTHRRHRDSYEGLTQPAYRKGKTGQTSPPGPAKGRRRVMTGTEELRARAARVLQAIDSTPVDAKALDSFKQTVADLRWLVEEVLTELESRDVAWLVWDCSDLAGVFATEEAARAFRTDRVAQMIADFGRKPAWADAITIVPARLAAMPTSTTGHRP